MDVQRLAARYLGGPVGRLRFDLIEMPAEGGGLLPGCRIATSRDLERAEEAGLLAFGIDHGARLDDGEIALVRTTDGEQLSGLLWLNFSEHTDRHGGRWSRPDSGHCYLNQLSVVPAARRQGVGSSLVGSAKFIAEQRDRRSVRALVRPDNEASLATFRRQGAVTVHRLYGLRLGRRSLRVLRPAAATDR